MYRFIVDFIHEILFTSENPHFRSQISNTFSLFLGLYTYNSVYIIYLSENQFFRSQISNTFLLFPLRLVACRVNFDSFKQKQKKTPPYSCHVVICNLAGFISLDCGLPAKESPYTESTTSLVFTSDANFISSGISTKLPKHDDYKPYNFLRYFPDGTRHCYDLSVKQGTNYLIRASFVYGNYDGRNIMPRFDLYIGPNIWAVVSELDLYSPEEEIIHMTKSTSLQICLVKTGPTTPFISTLELRPLRNDNYITQSGSLKLMQRMCMTETVSTLR